MLLDILEQNGDVWLQLVGCVNEGDEFNKYSDRIQTHWVYGLEEASWCSG